VSRNERKRHFAAKLLGPLERPLGFIDVGSGGPLKSPWSLLPSGRLKKYDIDPETQREGGTPVCISDRKGSARFNIAIDPRASSLHEASETFIRRHGQPDLRLERAIDVELCTLSDLFGHTRDEIDMVDINVEGHDGHVLRGAEAIFANNFIKLVKVEYELTEVWLGQSWFGEIDSTMRGLGYDLAGMMTDYHQPVVATGLRVGAEPIWGKALYVPGDPAWARRVEASPQQVVRDACLAGVCLYALFDLPGRALEVAALAESKRAANPALRGVPAPSELYVELESLHGTIPVRTRLARRLWGYLPLPVRSKLRPWIPPAEGA
jgi:hypothetical protein